MSRIRRRAVGCFSESYFLLDVETTGQTLEDIDLMFEGTTTIFLGPASSAHAKEIIASRDQRMQRAVEGSVNGKISDKDSAEIEQIEKVEISSGTDA